MLESPQAIIRNFQNICPKKKYFFTILLIKNSLQQQFILIVTSLRTNDFVVMRIHCAFTNFFNEYEKTYNIRQGLYMFILP